jgi:DNA replication ATP-dependent helicase Dna2
MNVSKLQYTDVNGCICKEQVLLLSAEGTKSTRLVHLRGFWYLTPVTEKAYVHVIGNFVGNRCIIDNNHNMLILHPDHLVSSTVVADSFSCTRRAVLQDRVKATGDAALPMVYGTILHEIFQTALVANRWDTEYLTEIIEDVATKHVEDLYTIKIQVEDARGYLLSKMGELQSWAELFVSSQPKVCANLSVTRPLLTNLLA